MTTRHGWTAGRLTAAIVALAGSMIWPASGAPDGPAPSPSRVASPCAADRPIAPHWVVDPMSAADDLPARGRSLFDYVVTEDGTSGRTQTVPFPFPALLQRISSRTAREARAAAPTAVLIPFGRSLQRNSAAPEFFAFPRAVVAIVAEPDGSRDPYLKDRSISVIRKRRTSSRSSAITRTKDDSNSGGH
jgi:hypothetical protein